MILGQKGKRVELPCFRKNSTRPCKRAGGASMAKQRRRPAPRLVLAAEAQLPRPKAPTAA
ncbi:hypothetical protein ACFQT0_12300 [Hymenobacter humi]|uniref:Uncharacterized protein n=1 Tax=Hymenobacter humi TaxID=1411620 RepID=A0ABW2U6R9_9BACT